MLASHAGAADEGGSCIGAAAAARLAAARDVENARKGCCTSSRGDAIVRRSDRDSSKVTCERDV